MHTSCTNAARKHAKIRMVWLDILLPQRSVSDMIGAVSQILTRLRRSEIELPAFSVTSSLSSLFRLELAERSSVPDEAVRTLPAVKSHVSHISRKLGVNRRSEARTAAQKLWLVPKDM